MTGFYRKWLKTLAAQHLGMNQSKGGETGRQQAGLCTPWRFSVEVPFLPHESPHSSSQMTYGMSIMNMDLMWFHLSAKLTHRTNSTLDDVK